MKKILFLSIVVFLGACKENSPQYPLLDTGVPQEMALYRSKQVSDVLYGLSFEIPSEKTTAIPAQLKMDLTILDTENPLYFDFKQNTDLPMSITVNGTTVPVIHEQEHLVIMPKYLDLGENTIKIDFIAGDMSLNRNDDYLYTLLVPDRARTLFPCFDQPDIKAHFDLTVTAPRTWKVLSGGKLEHQEEMGDFTKHNFAKTDKMSTYLFSFAAGKFEELSYFDKDFEMELLYRETNEGKIANSTAAIFDLHNQSVNFLEEYTGQEFPFQKLDFATIPGFQYGGMEHTGAIQYRESSLFLDSTATQGREIGRAKLIAHEVSHMWFGNLVTMKWFDDVWMKEVFANLMADKIINPAFPKVNHELQFITSHYPRAYSVDRTKGANAMRQNLDNLNNAGSLYGSIIYNKAPIMMRQLETILGKENFREGLREYIKTYANTNAEWPDLIAILDAKTDIDLKQWSNVWVNNPGRPIINGMVRYDKGKIQSFKINQKAADNSDKIWPQVFEIALVYRDSIHRIPINLFENEVEVHKAKGLIKPEAIFYNSNGLGYGIFPIDKATLFKTPTIEDEVLRGYSYINGYENTLNGVISPEDAIELYRVALKSEPNELILGRITANIQNLFWKYLNPKQRGLYQLSIEETIKERLLRNEAPRIKKTIFNLFSSIAYSDGGMHVLYELWNKERSIPNLNLSKDDDTNLAMQLALYGHPKTKNILESARSAIKNPDKLKRFEFLLPALSHDANVRTAFFESFREEENRAKENWVLTASSYIHHPLRQKESIKNLALSLEILEEIQQTGDIFFPKSWLDNTIGRYTTKNAFEIRGEFLEANPGLNPQLKMKLLQATDDLYRAQALIPSVEFNEQ